ncbi:hypothetical protein RND71_009314 [Anisodus tanguticus]|uniref:Pentatricopeptide repeat-containing protein n=1 Tax=Anisodus tanguticus TaxID=243964 RepID=A0AAE1SFK2_9SOLA|nr:hypothetical protein RND71_009314 [Anisodus tanguticus]
MRRAYGLKSRAEAYCCLVDILGCGKLVEEAIRVVNRMPPEECDGLCCGGFTWRLQVVSVGVANRIYYEIIEHEPGSSGAYVLMGNAYAAYGRWGDFAQVRKKMKETNVKKMRRAYGLKSRAKAYCCLVDILGCGKLVEEAIRVVNPMPPEECDGSSGAYVLMGNAYAASGRWGDFAQVRKKMKETNVKKAPSPLYWKYTRSDDYLTKHKASAERAVEMVNANSVGD